MSSSNCGTPQIYVFSMVSPPSPHASAKSHASHLTRPTDPLPRFMRLDLRRRNYDKLYFMLAVIAVPITIVPLTVLTWNMRSTDYLEFLLCIDVGLAWWLPYWLCCSYMVPFLRGMDHWRHVRSFESLAQARRQEHGV